ncbi:FtsX-like permease family protein [Dactylosporangium siamense]|uniref:ABC3 transporter permease C-terminal domain-containing protein n=1 Tax=Dactylosporangium siamense TaxID=685454 RepID=A0A919UE67_9ACTN|nr:FtsX-like permease family protein [Dactylosporangium siamense]GIG52149.1 hypothetical protein Dsi01nite_101900 [Dactylosporangium siamense]
MGVAVRVGVHLFRRGGREAAARIAVTAAAVAVGVALLLSVLAIYHGYEQTVARACWPCTGLPGSDSVPPPIEDLTQPVSAAPQDDAALWHYAEDHFRGHVIERLDVAALGSHAPLVPGLTRLPNAGEYYLSPALARLIAATPHDRLGDRFPGTRAGLIGAPGLSGPDDLAIVVGYEPATLAAVAGTTRITEVRLTPQRRGDTSIYRFGFGLGAVSLLLPMLVLIGNATRLAAARREERYAAMRLVGATPRQIGVIASVDSLLGALLGTVLGAGIWLLVRPFAARVTITGDRFFPGYVTPTALGYAAVLVGVPLAAAAAAVLSLRRVSITPLGVSRRVTPPPPRAWRVVPLLVGLAIYIVPVSAVGMDPPGDTFAVFGLILIMLGLVIGGTWLTMRASRLLGRYVTGPASLLAARWMADDPRTAFRSVSGLVLAVFVGTLVGAVLPAALAAQHTETDRALDPVLRVLLRGDLSPHGLSPDATVRLVGELERSAGVHVLPLYDNPANRADEVNGPPGGPPAAPEPKPDLVSCARLAYVVPLGRCAPGVAAVQVNDGGGMVFTDNLAALNKVLPIVTERNAPVAVDLDRLSANALLVSFDDTDELERVRTFLAVSHPELASSMGNGPRTFGEVAQERAAIYTEVGTVVLLVVATTLLVAGTSLAIAVGGGVVERKRPFTLLRVSGAAVTTLRRVVLIESLVPLLAAVAVAIVTGLAVAVPTEFAAAPPGAAKIVHLPGGTYYLTLAAGLLVSLAVIVGTMPILSRVTVPERVRFE